VNYTVDANAAVNAEIAQRDFVRTLAKTFTQISNGLAIFDRDRQLAPFNPALLDPTALPAVSLSARPNVLSFFDRPRDNRTMPESKNYNSWRHRMADLVQAAADGRYQETRSLPSGSIHRVGGRSHLDGAIAFLFEDIAAEVTLARQFRSDLELSQSMFDQVDDAITVFPPKGVPSFSNAAYRKPRSVDPESSFADATIVDATRDWQAKCRPSPIWGEGRDFVLGGENRAEWTNTVTPVTAKYGLSPTCTVNPVHSGATTIRFRESASAPAVEIVSQTAARPSPRMNLRRGAGTDNV